MDVGKRCQTTLNSYVCYYFSYGVIFGMFSRSFVGVSNFICGNIDYPTIILELWSGAHKGSRYCCLMEIFFYDLAKLYSKPFGATRS